MPFEIRQQYKLSQQLRMTPMLQQAINLLILSRQELVDAVQHTLLENPMLEELETEQAAAPREQDQQPGKDSDTPWDSGKVVKDASWEEYLDEFSSRSQTSQQEFETWEKNNNPLESCHAAKPNLQSHLMGQLCLSDLEGQRRTIGECIIGNLDDAGYLAATDAEIAQMCGATEEEVASVLSEVQNFDPTGVAAHDLSECLILQLRAKNYTRDPILVSIVKYHLSDLEKQRYKPLLRKFHIDLDTLQEYISIIQSLDPRPGSSYSNMLPKYISPDIYVRCVNGEFVVVMNDDDLPQLRLSPLSEALESKCLHCSDSERSYMEDCLQAAKQIIRSLDERQRTLYNVMESIVRRQKEFFQHGVFRLKPLILKDIAEDVGRSESSISRITTNKYVGTQHGIFELKFFFNSGLKTKNGDQVGSESIKAHIRSYISQEDPGHPLSDDAICEKVNSALQINIARRTISKYREELGIASSSRRRNS